MIKAFKTTGIVYPVLHSFKERFAKRIVVADPRSTVRHLHLEFLKQSHKRNTFHGATIVSMQSSELYLSAFQRSLEQINATRPTLSFKFLTDMVLGWEKSGAPLEKSILGFLEMLKAKRIEQAKETAGLLSDGDVILTHCNISGLLPLIAQIAKEQGKTVSFYATETRPYLQGSRLTAWELMRAGFEVTIITDNMVAYLLSLGKVTKIIVGADHLTLNGDIANKIGTYQIAVVAKYFKIPFFVICPPPSRLKTGQEIQIEIRPDDELKIYQGVRLAPKEVKAYYPAFDVTPACLITKHIHLGV